MHGTLRRTLVLAVMATTALATLVSSWQSAYAAEKTVYVGPQRVDCEGMGPQKCYQVKERLEDPWLLFYDEIEGFNYEEGYTYEIRVEETQVADPPADGASFKWRLLEVVSKTPAGSSQGTPLPQEMLFREWLLTTYQIARAIPRDVTNFGSTLKFEADGRAGGSGGCNSFGGPYQAGEGGSLTFGTLVSTRMACAEDIMQWESTYFQALDSASAYALEDTQLRITFANGQGTLTYLPKGTTGAQPGEEPDPTIPGMPATGTSFVLLLLAFCAALVLAGALLRRPIKQKPSAE
ncbi:MAG: DUF4377 domain-containing protein [Chloroflexota bacterium]|nr:DUF4377 domain-containing protein [Chloroflexota bacterium]